MGAPAPPQARMLGRYALYEKIASGGMASVHIGRLLGPVGFARTVAIKRMHPQFAEDPEFTSMFLDEARLAARIRHPNVVPTLDVVATEGELFLVMEYVMGESLARLVRAAGAKGLAIQPEMVTTIMTGVLHGLHAAHEAKNDRGEPLGIVHRDVSPHNVLVGIDGVARVLDFGVAKAAGRVQTTREGQLKGKLAYMAPEHIRGTATRLSDVYAASVVLWEALTGHRLFQGEHDAQLLDKVLRGCERPPSAYVPRLPPALDEIAMRGLSLDPGKRYPTARDMAPPPTARDMARALEALPMAPASTIGDWVEAVAKQSLEERGARIASIESDSALHAPPPEAMRPMVTSSPSSASGKSVPRAPISVPSVAGGEDLFTQLSSGSISHPARPSFFRQRPRAAFMAAAGGAAVLVLVAGTLVGLSRPGASRSPSSTQSPLAATQAAPALDPVVPSAPAPSTTPVDGAQAPAAAATGETDGTVASPTATLSVTISARPVTPAAKPADSPKSRAAPPPAPATAPAPNCNPPYTFDAQGLKYFKPECYLKR